MLKDSVPLVAALSTILAFGATLDADEQSRRPSGDRRAAAQPLLDSQEPGDKQKQEKLDFFLQRLTPLRLTAASSPDTPFRFVAEPLMTFENPVSQMWDGFMFVWADDGRPVAAMKCYYHSINKRWGRTFVSLATEPIELALPDKKQKLWMPQEAGIASFTPLHDSPKPASDARRRLTQMREIARRFEMVDRWGLKEPTDWQLRLLSTPLYRYEAPGKDVVDGAMFGYVVNSPEALVLLEARKTPAGLLWHYAVARFTRFEVTVSLDKKQIAHFPRLEAWPPTGVYFHDPVEVPGYPFARNEEAAQRNQ